MKYLNDTKYIYAVCYNTLDVFTSIENAINFYTMCYYGSEGHEQYRYANILLDLKYYNVGLDCEEEIDKYVWEIVVRDKDNNIVKKEKIQNTLYEDVIKDIEGGKYEL